MIKENRFHTLDSLRGLACLQVVIGHCLNSLPELNWMYVRTDKPLNHDIFFYLVYSPLHVLASGTQAVKLFFILSGFVLSLPYYRKDVDKSTYMSFFVKRILRLYIPCAVVITISLIVKETIYRPELTVNYDYFIKGLLSANFGGANFLNIFLLKHPINNLNPPLWTLPPEIKLSLILPFFVYLLKRLNVYGSFALIPGLIIFNSIAKRAGVYDLWPDLATLYYMTFFLIGSFVCKYKEVFINWANSLPKSLFYLLLVVSVYLYTCMYSLWWIPSQVYTAVEKYEDYIVGFAATIFLIFSLSKKFELMLNNSFLIFLGRISFSLYLAHCITILSCTYLLSNFLTPEVVIGVAFLLCFVSALLFYRVVELPSLEFSKYASDKFFFFFKKKDNNKPKNILLNDPA